MIENVELSVLVNGRKIRLFNHEGKTFLEGRENSEFTLEITNNNWARILAIPSIDSLSVIDGLEASNDSPGYIVQRMGSTKISGWRLDTERAASFKFSKKSESYVKGVTDSDRNVGIISIRVWAEKVPDSPQIHYYPVYVPTYVHPWPNYWGYPWWYSQSICGGASSGGGGTTTSLGQYSCSNSALTNVPTVFNASCLNSNIEQKSEQYKKILSILIRGGATGGKDRGSPPLCLKKI